MLWQCKALDAQRAQSIKRLKEVMPPNMYKDLLKLPLEERTYVLISGLGGSYIKEWQSIYISILDMVYKLYSYRIKQMMK